MLVPVKQLTEKERIKEQQKEKVKNIQEIAEFKQSVITDVKKNLGFTYTDKNGKTRLKSSTQLTLQELRQLNNETKILELFIPKQSAWCLGKGGLKLAVTVDSSPIIFPK